MELKRFFIDNEKIHGDKILIDNQEYYHIVKVMRYKKGYKLIISTGDGYDYHSIIEEINDRFIVCRIENKEVNLNNSVVEINLFAAMIKEDNYELMVQKAVELGVHSITPLITQYTSERNIRIDRLEKIALEASKQCGRASRAEIREAKTYIDAVLSFKDNYAIMAYEKEKKVYLKDIIPEIRDAKSISVIIGPEGGFSEEEARQAEEKGIMKFSLGKRILRAETASIVTLGNLIYELDR